jgi:NADH-quinone oxidoreductase subunit G
MARLTIDGREIEVADGTTVIQAAERLGISIPHYCYHPGLSISGNCRMCLVEIEKTPKLATACTQPVADGMVVHTASDKVKAGQRDVLEFLLKNHPLDCPVCDQAGECLLQDFYMAFAAHDSRLLETKNRKLKAKSVGPRIVLDQERCILCTRCVRFLTEVTKTSELGVFGRGSREVLDIFPGREVDNPYDGNIVDLCPVGALTDKDFRFRVRSWYLNQALSVCDECSTGCSIFVDYNVRRPHNDEGRRIVRFRPRFNPDVNGHWICNHGRYSVHKHEQNRLLVPNVRADLGWGEGMEGALRGLAAALREEASASPRSIGVIVAPSVSNEEAFLLRRLFVEAIGTPNMDYRIPGLVEEAGPDDEPVDGILRRRDGWPNSRGCAAVGLVPGPGGLDVSRMVDAAAQGSIGLLVVIGVDLTRASLPADTLSKALATATIVALSTHRSEPAARVSAALPIATHVEREGTFTNHRGIVQRFHEVVPPMGEARPLLAILEAIGRGAGFEMPPASPEAIFELLARDVELFKPHSYEELSRTEQRPRAHIPWVNEMIVPQL